MSRNRCEKCDKPKVMGIQQCSCRIPDVLTEYAWLVERHINGRIQYVSMTDLGVAWVSDPYEALRCCRRSDAEQLAAPACDFDDVRVVEHAFEIAPPSNIQEIQG